MIFGSDFECSPKQNELRQDKIENGIIPETNEIGLYSMIMDLSQTKSDSAFDIMFETNTKSYLTKCLSFAHLNNNTLQQEMKKIFTEYKNCHFEPAPVKC